MIAAPRVRSRVGRALGVDLRGALNAVGAIIKYLSLALAVPAAVAIGYSEPVWPFLAAGAVGLAFGGTLEWATRGSDRVGAREGFLIVSLTWLLAAALGSLPYVFSDYGGLSHPLDAYFEAMSGFTTTGATVITDYDGLPRSLAMWRQLTQWLGGMGIIVLALAILPRLRVGGRQLFEHEMPGPEIEALGARVRDTAQRLWLVYIGLTALQVLALATLGWTGADERMGLFEAFAHAFTTMPTGGFSTEARSIEAFAAASQWVIAVFMLLAGANFALLYRGIVKRRPQAFARDEEFRLYVGLLLLGSLILFVELLGEGLARGEGAVRHAVFESISTMTTTGYASADYTEWTLLAAVTIVALMFFGGSAGSTSGSVKVVRHLLIGKILRRELDQTVHPEVVIRVRLSGAPVEERTLRAVLSFVLLYVGLFALGALLLVLDAARVDLDLRLLDGVAASAAALGNVGPAFGFAGPMGSFDPFSGISKVIMIGLMWLGRLEIIPVIVLATRNYWRA